MACTAPMDADPASLVRVRDAIDEAFSAVDAASYELLAHVSHSSVATAACELPIRRAMHALERSISGVREDEPRIDSERARALTYGLDAAEREVLEVAKYLSQRCGGERVSRFMQELASTIGNLRRTVHGHTGGQQGEEST